MNIGVDATCYANLRGYGRFTRQVLPALVERSPRDTFVCFVDRRAAEAFDVRHANVRTVVVDLSQSPTLAAAADGRRSVADLWRLSRAVSREPLDVFFFPSVYTFFPLPPGLPAVVTIHDTIVERFPQLTLPGRAARLFWSAKVRAALWQATLVLTVSDYSAADIAAVLRVAPGRIRVALEAPAQAFAPVADGDAIQAVARRYGIPAERRWFIYVGGFNPHKNVEHAVRAHAAIVRRTSEDAAPLLVLVGPAAEDVFHGSLASIRAAIASEHTTPLVHWLGYVPDEDLRHLYAGAIALVLPSAAEGFGLPAIEAARCGTPVVATTASPLPSLLAGGGIFVAPGDTDGLLASLSRFCDDAALRRLMGAVALERSSALSWDRTADAVASTLYEAGAAGAWRRASSAAS